MSTDWPWPLAVDDGAARHLTKGYPMPRLSLPSTEGQLVDPGALPGRTVFFVYPWTGAPGVANPPNWDNIPGAHGSTPEAESFRNLHSAFVAQRIAILGISGQNSNYQREFQQRNRLPFSLLSDHDLAWSKALRLPTFETGGVIFHKRITLILANGKIERFYYPIERPDTHPREVLAWCSATASYAR